MNQKLYNSKISGQSCWTLTFVLICLLLVGGLVTTKTYGQCLNSSPYGNVTLSATVSGSAVIGCQYAGEYGTWNGAVTGNTYNFTSTISTDYVTIRTGSPAGPVAAFGTQPLSWTSTVTGTIYVHINTNAACGTQNSCRDITGTTTAIFVPGCTNTSPYGNVTLSGTVSGFATIGCQYAGEYGTWNGAVTGNTYNFTSTISTDFLTIHTGSPAGPIVASGTQPLSWTSTVTGTIYVHCNTNSSCGTQNSCRDITGTTTAIYVPGCTNTSPYGNVTLSGSVSGFATIGCQYAGEYGTWNGALTGYTYNFTSTVGTDYLTIHTGSPGGPIVASGTQPLSWVSTVTGTIYVHCNTNSSCGTQNSCRDITGTTTGIFIPGCTNTTPYGNVTLSNSVGGFATIGCQYAGEYGTWNNAVTGSTYNFTSTIGTDYLTIHTGSPSGPIVASGTQPVSWSSTVTGTIYVHCNTNSACGTQSSCRDITGTTTGILCNIGVTASANTNTFCNSGSPTITAVATGNNGAVTYTWNPGGLTGSVINPTVTTTTVYTVTATDATPAGCTATATVLITINNAVINTAATATTICNGGSSTLSATTGTALSWTETLVNGVTTTAQCQSWDAFRASLNPAPYTSCKLSGSFDLVGRTATTPATVQAIASALKNATNYTQLDGGNTWVVETGCGSGCGGGVVELTADGTGCDCGTGYRIRPNLVGSNSGGVNTETCGGPTQTITVTFSSLGPLSSYSWAPSASLSCSTCPNPVATPTVTTTYTITGTNSSGCTATATVTVNVINVVASCSGTNVSVCNGNNGSATINVTGGAGPYTFSWSNGTTAGGVSGSVTLNPTKDNTIFEQNQNNSNGLGTAFVAGKNGANFAGRALMAFDIAGNIPSGVTITGATLNLHCSESPGGANQNFELRKLLQDWGEGTSFSGSFGLGTAATTNDATWLNRMHPSTAWSTVGGTFSGTVSAVTSVADVATYSWSSTGMQADVQSWLNTPSSNYGWLLKGLETASLQARRFDSRENSTPGFRPSLTVNYTSTITSHTINNLTAGTYCVTVTDANGCTSTCCYTVTQPSLAATAVATDATCGTCADGTVTVNSISGGTAPYSYSPSNPLTNLLPGTYCITVTDANGCTASACATVSIVGCSLTASCSVNNNVSCNGGSNGSATVTAGGTIVGPLTYLWDNGSTNATVTGLNAGSHLVTVTDQGTGCIASCSSVITQPAGMTISGSNTNVACAESTTGSITISVAGGASPYTFLWSNSATTQNIGGLTAGTYTVTVTDANGCTASYSRTVNCSDNTDPVLSAGPGGGTLISETFEAGLPAGWAATGLWHVTNACPTGTPPNPTYWAYYGIDGQCNYNSGVANSGDLTSNTVSIPAGTTSATLRFRFVYNGEGGAPPTGYDNASLKVSQNGEAHTQAYAISTAGSFGAWMTANVNMNAFIGSTVALQWNFTTVDGIANATIGLQVDSVRLEYVLIKQCPDDIVATNDPGVCGTTVSWTPPTATDNCNVTLTSNKNPGDFFPVGTTVVTYTAADGCGNTTSCSFNVTVNLVGPPILTLTETHVNADCQGAPTGSIDLNVVGGATPYSYLWSNGTTTQDVGSLIVGVYTVVVTEANGCSATLSVSIGDFPPLQTSENHVNILCNGDLTGSIDITATDGKPGYDYLWNDGTTTEDRTGIGAGTYTVTISDQCFSVQTITITITEPPAFISVPLVNNVSCFGACNGNIAANVSGGVTLYSYIWSNSQTTTGITGLCPGIYSVLVTDANGCTVTGIFNITEPPQVFVTETNVDVSCFLGSNGSVDVTVTGGSPPFSYLWSNGATTEDVSGLNANTFFVTVTESNGCVTNLSVPITSPPVIVITPTLVNPSSMNIIGGSINTSVSGGVPGYTYLWSNSATTSGISGLSAGNYTLTVTDANGCTRQALYTLTLVCKLGAINVVNQNTSCYKNNGIVTVTGTGGTGYTYQWQTVPVQTTATGTGLNYGKNNYVLITDIASGCTYMDTVVKPHTTSIGISLTSPLFGGKNIHCNGGSDGTINVAISGDPGPFTYIWNDGTTTQNRTGLPAGVYMVTVSTGSPGCRSTAVIALTQPSALNASASGVNPSCGGNNGTATASASGGVAPYSYSWNSVPAQTTITATGLAAGTYIVTVTDANGCTKTATKTLAGGGGILITAVVTDAKCFGAATGSINITPSGGNPGYTYLWSNGATTQDQINKLVAGTYTVTVTDGKGCTGVFSATIAQPSLLIATAVSTNITCNGAQNGTANVTASGGTPPYTYSWNTSPTKTTANVTGLKPGTWTCLVTDSKGCVKAVSVTITQPAIITIAISKTNVTTFGGNNGTATATASGGIAPYSYSWNSAPVQNTQTATGLTAGTYTVTVTDANGCTKTKSVTITQPSARLLDIDKSETEASALLYPNPTTGFITITFNEVVQSKVSIDIYNFTGMLVYSKQVKAESNSNSFNLDLSQLAKGIYTVKYQTGDHDWIDKLVIQ